MKTDICYIGSKGTGTQEALDEIERCAIYRGLDKRSTLQLRLLGEELMSLMREVSSGYAAQFWVETKGEFYELHLVTETQMQKKGKEKLLSVSKDGKNAANKGVMGKVRSIFEACLDSQTEVNENYFLSGMVPAHIYGMNGGAFAGGWSLKSYTDAVKGEKKEEEWDELEKSIVANLADDVIIGVRNNKAEIIILKKFKK